MRTSPPTSKIWNCKNVQKWQFNSLTTGKVKTKVEENKMNEKKKKTQFCMWTIYIKTKGASKQFYSKSLLIKNVSYSHTYNPN